MRAPTLFYMLLNMTPIIVDALAYDNCIRTKLTYEQGARCLSSKSVSTSATSYRKTVGWCCSEYGRANKFLWTESCIKTGLTYAQGGRCMTRNGGESADTSYRKTPGWCCTAYGRDNDFRWMVGPGLGSSGGGCFPPDTLVVLSTKAAVPISTLRLGDQLEQGGTVQALMQLQGSADPLFDVGGVRVSGSHAVRDPSDGVWRRVESVGQPLNTTVAVLWNVISEHHRVVAVPRLDGGAAVELADFMEANDTPALLQRNLRVLNGKEL